MLTWIATLDASQSSRRQVSSSQCAYIRKPIEAPAATEAIDKTTNQPKGVSRRDRLRGAKDGMTASTQLS
jgi:hypothetical protein